MVKYFVWPEIDVDWICVRRKGREDVFLVHPEYEQEFLYLIEN